MKRQHRVVGNVRPPLILHVVECLRGGGAEAFVRELIPTLDRHGFDGRALCAYGDSRLTDAEAASWAGKVYYQRRDGVPRLRYLREMRRIVRQVAPDIVHTHTHVGAVWGRAAALLERVPIVVHTEHQSLYPLPFLDQVANTILTPRTDVIVTFSERAAALVRRREKVRDLHVIPNGIRVRPQPTAVDRRAARKKLGVEESHVVTGMLANLEAHKNPGLAIEAIALLPLQDRTALRFAFFGSGSLRGNLEMRVRELGIEEIVRFYGFRSDVEELLPGLDFIVSTSAREMMPMSLLESMNAALPIIGAPHGGTLDLVIDGATGIVLKTWSAQELADAIHWAAVHAEWRVRAGQAAHARVREHYNVETSADKYAQLYRTLLDDTQTRRQKSSRFA